VNILAEKNVLYTLQRRLAIKAVVTLKIGHSFPPRYAL